MSGDQATGLEHSPHSRRVEELDKHLDEMRKSERFGRFAKWTARATGKSAAFLIAVVIILAWAISGPLFSFSDTWQLVINTGTTIVTFLMVFLIQHTQNRDSEAMHLKLNEIIRATHRAHNALIDAEELTETELNELHAKYNALAQKARTRADQVRAESHGQDHGRKHRTSATP